MVSKETGSYKLGCTQGNVTGTSQDTLPSVSGSKEDDVQDSEKGNVKSSKVETEGKDVAFEKPLQTSMKSKIATISGLLKNKPLGMPPPLRKSRSVESESKFCALFRRTFDLF